MTYGKFLEKFQRKNTLSGINDNLFLQRKMGACGMNVFMWAPWKVWIFRK